MSRTSESYSTAEKFLQYAERHGISIGGLFLIALGLYAGQYARLFPERIQDYAGGFCLFVAACGLGFVVWPLALRSLISNKAVDSNDQQSKQKSEA